MLTCRDASRLASEVQDRPLGARERLSLWIHLAMCALCRRYAAQLEFVRRAAERLRSPDGRREGLSAEARQLIRSNVEGRFE
jgi:hypothetical protein